MKSTMMVVVFSFLAAAGIATAQDSSMQRGPMRMWMSRRPSPQLKLTDTQKKDIQKIRFDLRQKQIDIKAKLSHAQLDYEELASADNPDEGAISDKLDEISQLQTSLKKNLLDGWFAVNKLLTPDQQKVWKKVLQHPRMAMRRMNSERIMIRRRAGQSPMTGEMMMRDDSPMSDGSAIDIGTMADMWGLSDLDPLIDEQSLLDMPPAFDTEMPGEPGDMMMQGPAVIQHDDQQDPDQ